jgi:hypothetical protein
LDRELQVLTNYRIPVSSYDANPAAMPGAIFIPATSEYRLPSLSTVDIPSSESYGTNIVNVNNDRFLHSGSVLIDIPIYPYNSYGVSSTNRCVRAKPDNLTLDGINISFSCDDWMRTSLRSNNYTIIIYFGDLEIFTISLQGNGVENIFYWTHRPSITAGGITIAGGDIIGENGGNWHVDPIRHTSHGFLCIVEAGLTNWVVDEYLYAEDDDYDSFTIADYTTIHVSRVPSPFTQDVIGNSGLRAVLASNNWPTVKPTSASRVILNNMA